MTAYYNEHEPFAAAWLRNLIAANMIAPGEVDERSIVDVQPDDVRGFTQCHFFAGIGIWSHALRSAGWEDARPVCSGSCPCQPFSCAGKQLGTADKRHLWPAWFRLIRECRPPALFGEQVAGPAALAWLDLVSADLEDAGYAVGAADLCAASVGAPHIRQRLYWMAYNWRDRLEGGEHADGWQGEIRGGRRFADASDEGLRLANTGCAPRRPEQLDEPGQGLRREPGPDHGAGAGERGGAVRLADPAPGGQRIDGGAPGDAGHATQRESDGRLGNTDGCTEATLRGVSEGPRPDAAGGFWSAADWLPCRDGKARPVEPGSFPLAHGVAGRVGRLRAYGNALCAPVAAEFVRAAMGVGHAD